MQRAAYVILLFLSTLLYGRGAFKSTARSIDRSIVAIRAQLDAEIFDSKFRQASFSSNHLESALSKRSKTYRGKDIFRDIFGKRKSRDPEL